MTKLIKIASYLYNPSLLIEDTQVFVETGFSVHPPVTRCKLPREIGGMHTDRFAAFIYAIKY